MDDLRWQAWVFDLYQLIPALSKATPNELAQRVLEHIVSGFRAASGSLALREAGTTSCLTVVAVVPAKLEVIGSNVGNKDGMLAWVAEHGEPLIGGGEGQADIRNLARSGHTRPVENGSAICWPLTNGGKSIGALRINRLPVDSPFTQDDLAQGNFVLGLLTVAIANAHLLADQARHIKATSKLHATVDRMSGQLEQTYMQLLQADKMASIGQLAAGVAHEINNPIGYVNANLGSLEQFLQELFAVLAAYAALDSALPAPEREHIEAVKSKANLAYLRKDSFALLGECREGIGRVKKIVQDLRDFSRVDARDEWRMTDLHKGLDSTLNIVNNEIKYRANVVKEYGDLPEIECLPVQLNQVFMNILMNAAQAMRGSGTITVRTGIQGDGVWVAISDTGCGIPADQIAHVFEPFYTTKNVGEGTGLGLSLAYGIVKKHGGRIHVHSEVGSGTTFRVVLPRQQTTYADVRATRPELAA